MVKVYQRLRGSLYIVGIWEARKCVDCRCALSGRARKGTTSERASEGKHDRGYKLSEGRLWYRILYSLPKIHQSS